MLKHKIDKVELKIFSFLFYWILLIRPSHHPLQGTQVLLSSPDICHPSIMLSLASSKYVNYVTYAFGILLGLLNLI